MVNNLQVLVPHVFASSVDEQGAQCCPRALLYYLELVVNILILIFLLIIK